MTCDFSLHFTQSHIFCGWWIRWRNSKLTRVLLVSREIHDPRNYRLALAIKHSIDLFKSLFCALLKSSFSRTLPWIRLVSFVNLMPSKYCVWLFEFQARVILRNIQNCPCSEIQRFPYARAVPEGLGRLVSSGMTPENIWISFLWKLTWSLSKQHVPLWGERHVVFEAIVSSTSIKSNALRSSTEPDQKSLFFFSPEKRHRASTAFIFTS